MIAAIAQQPILDEKTAYQVSFYDLIDKEKTYESGKDLMEIFQKNWRSKTKTGGINSTTFDLFFAIIRSIAPTMEDIKRKQQGLFEQCREHGEFFCFTTLQSLANIMNNLHNHKVLQVCRKTIHNHIQKLIEVGIITKKVNFQNSGKRNPYPAEEDPKGRGKFQLWITPKVLKFNTYNEGAPTSFFAPYMKDLPQYEQSSLQINGKELKSIDNTAQMVEKVASAIAEINSSNIESKEQGSKSAPPSFPNFSPENLTKKDFVLQQLWALAQYNLWGNYNFNFQTITDSKILISELLKFAEDYAVKYRKERIEAFKQNPAFFISKNQDKLLNRFTSTIPKPDQAAVEIVAHAILKQKKYSEKKGNLEQLYYPVNYFTSASARRALDYSIADWRGIQEKYFFKNKNSHAYFEEVRWIMNRYSIVIEEIMKFGKATAYNNLKEKYNRWLIALRENIYLNEANINELTTQFTNKFKPIFQ